MPRHHTPPTWVQPPLIPAEFVRVEVRLVLHGPSQTCNVSVRIDDPDGDDVHYVEVTPVCAIDEALPYAQALLTGGFTTASALVPPF